MVFLLAVVWIHVGKVAGNHIIRERDSMRKLAEKIFDKLIGRALKVWSLHQADLDDAALAKFGNLQAFRAKPRNFRVTFRESGNLACSPPVFGHSRSRWV